VGYNLTVCSGTKNALSMTGSSDMQYKLIKEMYTGCEIVMGNLEIIMMEPSRNFSFLQSIREVTGYILIGLNQFSRLPLDNLRVIRGTTLYEGRFALAVLVNYQKDGQYGLQELGLTHLTEILEGGVQIIQNKFLSFAPQINWLDIVKDSSSEIIFNDNGPESESQRGDGKVLNVITKTICAPQCNGRCFGRSPGDCCHMECAGGCTGPHDTNCSACRNFNNSGSCVPQCPKTHIYSKLTFKLERNPSAKYQYGSICVAQCPSNFVVDESSCVSSCPKGKMEVEKTEGVKRCEPCGGPCPKVCIGTGPAERQTVDALNIESFRNCTKIQGSLHFLVTGIKGDDYKNIPAIDPEKLKIFSTVREITDYLNIQSWPTNMSDLSVFSNLQTIEGRTLYKGYALLVIGIKSLTSLGLRSLRKINDGGVYITRNQKLCYQENVNWTRLSPKSSRPRGRMKNIDVKENGARARCVKEGHTCDPLCSSDGCWGPGPSQCLACKNYRLGGTCVEQCMFLTGDRREFATAEGECVPCHAECELQHGRPTCTGPGADQCVACARNKDGPHCVSTCPKGLMGEGGVIFKYPDRQHKCEPCHLNCTQGCDGPNIGDCLESRGSISSRTTTGIVVGVIALLFVSFSIFVLTVLYRRGLAIRRKRAMRRYMESGESFEPLDPSEKGAKVHARILKVTDLRKIKLLGQGVFGTVHKGIWIPEGDTVKLPVAIKTISDRTGRQKFHEITDHMLSLGSLDHINVVRILGICPGDNLQLVTPLSSQGSLLEHIKHRKNNLSPQRLLNWCVQIAKGMYYLEEHRMVHRNLAARNVLLKNDYMVQISDYGIADLLYPDEKKYFYNEVKTPIKWMALESILFRRYTHQSDVWSYGVTVWEMMSYGTEPYPAMRPQEVPDLLEKGERLSQPTICTIDVYMVMVKCWMIDENVRPTFKELANEFTRMARDPPRYLVIKVSTFIMIQNTSSMAGYLPMTPGVDCPGQSSVPLQGAWPSRSRLNSARTVSESSEGRGTVTDQDMNEDFSLTGSLRRKRQREDSAYLSQRDSMSGGPPQTPSPDIHNEEDQNGYVLPGESPKRGTTTGLFFSLLHRPDPDQEDYEYMNKHTASRAAKPPGGPLKDGGSWVQMRDLGGHPPREEQDEAEDNYQYTNRQPKLRQALEQRKEGTGTGPGRGQREACEYEDMNSLSGERGGEEMAVYQNLVRAGASIGEPAGVDRSFDNPDYWHSRMFLKSNAVRT
uniref:Receptor protein-tyrosine kinase n=1 Tax=Gadus morhua TaxID=8049 RepID=A0A8C4Z8Z9_GADMO